MYQHWCGGTPVPFFQQKCLHCGAQSPLPKDWNAWKEQSWRKHWICARIRTAVKATLPRQHPPAWWVCFQNDINHINTHVWMKRASSLLMRIKADVKWTWLQACATAWMWFSTRVSSWTETDAVTPSSFSSSANHLLRHAPGYFPALSLHLTLCLLSSTNSRSDHIMRGKKATLKCCMGVLVHLCVALSCLLSMYAVNLLWWCLKSRVSLNAGQWADNRGVYRV